MRRTKITTSVVALFLLMDFAQAKADTNVKGKPTLDLEDYIDTPNSKKEDLSTSATGYYGHHHQPYHGHSHSHTDYHQHHHQPIYHHQPVAYGHHHHHHSPYDYGHAQTYFAGEYGGLGHVGSAHVSYGTEINHGHSHHHHHSHGYYG